MRDYSKVSPHFWIGSTGRKIRALGRDAQVVAFYLMTSPHATMIGLYYVPIAYIAHETGVSPEAASKALRSLEAVGFLRYDFDAEVIWVVSMARFQIGDQLEARDKRCAGVQNSYNSLPANRFLGEFFDRYAGAYHMKQRRDSEAPSKSLQSQEQEQAKEQEEEHENLEHSANAECLSPAKPATPVRPFIPNCPIDEIIAMYHKTLPAHPCVRARTAKRERLLRARWNAMAVPKGKRVGYTTVEEGLTWWRRFFAYVARSPLLSGQVERRDSPPFIADLEWLIRPSNFVKVCEGRYHVDDDARGSAALAMVADDKGVRLAAAA